MSVKKKGSGLTVVIIKLRNMNKLFDLDYVDKLFVLPCHS